MSFLKKGLGDVKTDEIVKQGKEAVEDTINQCIQEGQQYVQEVVDKGTEAAKDAANKAVTDFKTGFKQK
ncbi:hypothetical protein XELAEV_18000648mg [Xenopus laevis]|nr:hypothetical protein XELAEV_18000648mg [Xenopus laevis]